MPKPRKWNTGLKHLGTILWHPQQYYRYRTQRDAFVRENHLPLHDYYHGELVAPTHPYPGAHGASIRERGVIYPGADHAQTAVGAHQLTALAPFDHQQARGVNPAQLGADRSTLVVLHNEGVAGPVLRAAKKRGAHGDANFPDIGRTQHTTLAGGEPVAAAALLHQGRVIMSSGHYQPEEQAAVKLAIHGKQSGTLLRRETDIVDEEGQRMDMTMKRRMQVVSDWARNR